MPVTFTPLVSSLVCLHVVVLVFLGLYVLVDLSALLRFVPLSVFIFCFFVGLVLVLFVFRFLLCFRVLRLLFGSAAAPPLGKIETPG